MTGSVPREEESQGHCEGCGGVRGQDGFPGGRRPPVSWGVFALQGGTGTEAKLSILTAMEILEPEAGWEDMPPLRSGNSVLSNGENPFIAQI